MKDTTKNNYEELFVRCPVLEMCRNDILAAFEILFDAYKNGKKLLVCGNGGSAADSEHIVGELLKRFKKPRKLTPKFMKNSGCSARMEQSSKPLSKAL